MFRQIINTGKNQLSPGTVVLTLSNQEEKRTVHENAGEWRKWIPELTNCINEALNGKLPLVIL
jgi:hypothetical protein